MTTSDERPSAGERYTKAIDSSDLRVQADRRGDSDSLIAMGWVPEFFGSVLFRLHHEYDLVRTGIRRRKPQNMTEQILVRQRLKTLTAARESLIRFAAWRAAKDRLEFPAKDIENICGRALSAFLDDTCPHCEGRGFSGGGRHEQSGKPELCRPCRGSGRAFHNIGKTDAERKFATTLLASMSELKEKAERGMRCNRDAVDAAKKFVDGGKG